jgi:hypothetical protein
MAEIKVFKVNDYEWWAGADLTSIHEVYEERTGIDPDDADEGFDHPQELSTEEMEKKTIHFEEGPTPDTATFQEYLDEMIEKGAVFPCFFAGTEC